MEYRTNNYYTDVELGFVASIKLTIDIFNTWYNKGCYEVHKGFFFFFNGVTELRTRSWPFLCKVITYIYHYN